APHAQDGAPREFPPAARHETLFADATIPPALGGSEPDYLRQPKFLHDSESRARWKPRFSTPGKYQATVKDYLRLITGVDEMVGAIVARLAERNHLDDTIFVVIGDNGFFLGERGFADKWYMYEESIRVPLLICDPRVAPQARGRVEPALALNIDVAPTIYQLLGLNIPAGVQGRSLEPFLSNEDVTTWRDRFFYEHLFKHAKIPPSEGVRTERWAYIRWIGETPAYEELFDLQNDPHEQTNLAGDPQHAATLTEMRAQWETLRREAE
ncbi:MAG TPA: sulfatase/phosphatase domain-containing protein, partial [Pirellulales bacterium]